MRSSCLVFIFFLTSLAFANINKRQFASCPASAATIATPITLNGPTITGFVNSTTPCIYYSFTVPSTLDVDIIFTTSVNSGTVQVNLVDPTTNTVLYSLQKTPSGFSADFTTGRVPAFVLAGKSWHLRFFNQITLTGSVTFQFNTSYASSATVPGTIPGKTTISEFLNIYPTVWQITIPEPNKAYVVTVSNIQTSYPPANIFLALNRFPSAVDTQAYQGTSTSIRMAAPGDKVYVEASTQRNNVSVSFDVDVQPVKCSPLGSGDQVCGPYTSWNTGPYSPGVQQAELSLALDINAMKCSTSSIPVICGIIFPKCDDNGFPLPPCPSDCETVQSSCSSQSCTSPPGVATYCYATQTNGPNPNNTNRTIASLTLLILFISLWM